MWTCRIVDLEVTYGSRARDVADIVNERAALPVAPIDPVVMDRAVQVAGLLAKAGHHRGAKPVDLVIAAATEASSLAVLHCDNDYDRIAAVTIVALVAMRATRPLQAANVPGLGCMCGAA